MTGFELPFRTGRLRNRHAELALGQSDTVFRRQMMGM